MTQLSLITVNFNNRDGLERTIKSVISQNEIDFEYIIIDGGSTDGSADIINNYHEHFAYSISEADKGVYDAMNKGIAKATGKYLLFLNSGDVLLDEYVLKRLQHSFTGDTDIISCNAINEDWVFRPSEIVSPEFFLTGSLPHQSTFIKRELMVRLNGYNDNLRIIGDWDFFVRALIFEKATYMVKDIYVAHNEAFGLSAGVLNNDKLRAEHQVLVAKYFPELLSNYPKDKSFVRRVKNKIKNVAKRKWKG